MDLTQIGNNLRNLFNQGSNFVQNDIVKPVENTAGNFVHTLTSPIDGSQTHIGSAQPINIPQIQSTISNFNPGQALLSAIPGYNALNQNVLKPLNILQTPTVGQIGQNLQHQAQVVNAMGTPTSQTTPQVAQLQKEGVNDFLSGIVGGGEPTNFSEDQLNLVRNGFTKDVRNLVGQFAEKVESSSNPNQLNLGALGDYVHSLGEEVFGPQAANLTNLQLKNAFDAIQQQAAGKVASRASIGLATNDIRDGEVNPAGKDPQLPEPQTTDTQGNLPNTTGAFQGAPNLKDVQQNTMPIQKPEGQVLSSPKQSINPSGGIIPQDINPERQFITSAKQSQEVSPQTQAKVEGNYQIKSNDILKENSAKLLSQGLDKATNIVLTDLGAEKGKLSDQAVSDAIMVAKAHDAAGNFDQATHIYDQLAQHLTEAGRQVQAASLLENRTPQGLLYSAVKTFQKAGVERTPGIQQQLEGLVGNIKNTQPGSDARNMATQKLVNFVNGQIPRSRSDAITGIWRAGLLTGPETVAKVAVSHAMSTPLDVVSQIPASIFDRATSLVTGKRGTVFTIKGAASGVREGLQAAGTKMASGIDVPNTGGFGSELDTVGFGKSGQQTPYEKFVYNLHGSISKPAYKANYNMSLNRQALTEAANQGLQGAEKDAFIKNFIENPSDQAKQIANDRAALATNQQKTSGGKIASALQNIKVGPVPVGKFLTPFTRIPSALGTNGLINYTPFGLAKEVVNAVKSGNFDQRALSEAFGRSTTGTGIIALGALLAQNGLMTLKAPSDQKEQALWRMQGKQPNSIKVGNNWISLNSFGPIGLTLAVGAGLHDAAVQSKGDPLGAIAGAIQSGLGMLADQPYVKGISGAAKAISNPSQFGNTFMENTVGSIIPALSTQIARGTDTTQRMYPTGTLPQRVTGKLASEIPGLAEQQAPQRDLFGRPLPGANPSGSIMGGIIGTINPFYPSQSTSDPVSGELQRLYDNLGSSGSPTISQPTAKQTIAGQKVTLDNQQLSNFIAQAGPQIKQDLQTLFQDPNYQSLTDAQKVNAVNGVITKDKAQTKIGLNTGQQTAVNTAQAAQEKQGIYTLIDPTTGTAKKIDISRPIPVPQMTGNYALDQKLMSGYNSALTTRANDIVTLYKNNKIDAATAEKALEQLASQKIGSGKSKGKVTVAKTSMPKAKPITLKLGLKGSRSGGTKGLRLAASPKLKMATTKVKAGKSSTFKVTAPRVYLSTQGASQRGMRKIAGISVPVRRHAQPHLTI